MVDTVIIGLGQTGLSCVRYFQRKNIPVAVTDTRDNPPGLAELSAQFPKIPVALGGLNPAFIEQANHLIVSPGVSLQLPLLARRIERGVLPIGDIELFVREAKAPIIGITGSNGKTTVTTLIGEVIAAAGYRVEVCGNIGKPVLDVLNQPTPDYYVIELSSFQLETTYSLRAAVAILLNVSPDHMDRYATYADYLRAKQRIYTHCQHAVVNYDEPEIWQELKLAMPCSGFSMKSQQGLHLAQQNNRFYLADGKELLLSVDDVQLKARHHLQNALSVLAVGKAIGLPMSKMLEVIKDFRGLPHRCQLVAQKNAVQWYNDSKGTNIGATIAAIESCSALCTGDLLLIAGGQGKGADFSTLKAAVEKHIKQVILLGEDAEKIKNALGDCVAVHHVASLLEALNLANHLTKPNDVVLFSPASASFDMFKNYVHRGEVFEELVRKLTAG